jgi:hypothetical protein
MSWKNFWKYLKSIWEKICNRKTSSKNNSFLDTASLKIFGLDIKITRELPINGPPYELTVVVPRAELRVNKKNGNQEIILSSITIAHSPRFEKETEQKNPITPKSVAA